MSGITVKQLAQQTKREVYVLIKQLKSFGIEKHCEKDILTYKEIKILLEKINITKNKTNIKKTNLNKLDNNKHKINILVKRKRKIIKTTEEQKLNLLKEIEVMQTITEDPNLLIKNKNKIEQLKKNKNIQNNINKISKNEIELIPIKNNGFKITSMPEYKNKENITKNNEKLNLNHKIVKTKINKKIFNKSFNSTKNNFDEDNKKFKTKKSTYKNFKKTNSRQLLQLANDAELFENFNIKKNKIKNLKIKNQEFIKPIINVTKNIEIYEGITVNELAQKMSIKSNKIIKILFDIGIIATINQSLDQDTAIFIIEEIGHKYTIHNKNALEESLIIDRSLYQQISRPPIVTIMGHVDHGKTSLLDYICKTKIVNNEIGGITQHIRAHYIKINKNYITFLDTPGHEAFTSMRARGVSLTDIIILVVAANDGVMPQTIEAINFAKEAKVPIIVAINKIDKLESKADKVINELAKINLTPEKWGGDTMYINTSAKTGEGINDLIEAIFLQSEILELKAFQDGLAEGIVIESRLEIGRGSVINVIIKNGTIKNGDIILCGIEYGKVRSLYNDLGKKINIAGPSMPVQIIGLSGIPKIGDKMIAVENEKKAKILAIKRLQQNKEIKISKDKSIKTLNIFKNINKKIQQKILKIILKCDVQGSVEAINKSLLKLENNEVKIDIIISNIGMITSSDITLAATSTAIIIGFNIKADNTAKKLAEIEKVKIYYYNIIYDLIDDVKKMISNLLSPKIEEQTIGIAEVREIYHSSKFGLIAGCIVINGIIKRTKCIHIVRNNNIIYKGMLESIKRFKEDVSEVKKGLECGIAIKNFNNIHKGDQIKIIDETIIN